MTPRAATAATLGLLAGLGLLNPGMGRAAVTTDDTPTNDADADAALELTAEPTETTDPVRSSIYHGREYFVPELAENTFAIDPGPRDYLHRFAFSPAFGRLGDERFFAFRAAFNPNRWLGWEASIGHNPGQSVHALTHSLNAVVRYPLPWRIQPYGTVGYGMIMVFPGEALNSDPVTENLFSAGGGVELYVRNDLAFRFDARSLTVPGGDPVTGGSTTYQYRQFTAGLSFYRGLAQ
ncbi:MAG: hypothetical protein HKN12_07730 [Gemmatimonadetes bacterium]|nr:hypothetical protein [Gemmatimonadota bacterium]